MFMNQISIFESDEMTAFGFFNINLTLILTVSIMYAAGYPRSIINSALNKNNNYLLKQVS